MSSSAAIMMKDHHGNTCSTKCKTSVKKKVNRRLTSSISTFTTTLKIHQRYFSLRRTTRKRINDNRNEANVCICHLNANHSYYLRHKTVTIKRYTNSRQHSSTSVTSTQHPHCRLILSQPTRKANVTLRRRRQRKVYSHNHTRQ